jgi:DNA-binding XRE family transcriptional regulator
MGVDTIRDGLRSFDLAQQRFMLAMGIVLEHVRRLPKDDLDDLLQVLMDYRNAECEEDREAAEVAILEILGQESVGVEVLNLNDAEKQSDDFQKWLAWISKTIHDRRHEAGLTQEQLASKSGLPQSHISRLENGRHSPSRYTLEKIARALNLPVNSFDLSAE